MVLVFPRASQRGAVCWGALFALVERGVLCSRIAHIESDVTKAETPVPVPGAPLASLASSFASTDTQEIPSSSPCKERCDEEKMWIESGCTKRKARLPPSVDFNADDYFIGNELCGSKIPTLVYSLAVKYMPWTRAHAAQIQQMEDKRIKMGLENITQIMEKDGRGYLIPKDGTLELVKWHGKKTEVGESDTLVWRYTPHFDAHSGEEPIEYILVCSISAQPARTLKIALKDGLVPLNSGTEGGWRDMWEEREVIDRITAAQQKTPVGKNGVREQFMIGQYIGHKANKLWTKYGLGQTFRQVRDEARAATRRQRWVMGGLSHGAALAQVISLRWDLELNPVPSENVFTYLFNSYKTMNTAMGAMLTERLRGRAVHFISADVKEYLSKKQNVVKYTINVDAVPGAHSDRYNAYSRYLVDGDGVMYRCQDGCPEDCRWTSLTGFPRALKRILELHRNSGVMPRLAALLQRCPSDGSVPMQPIDREITQISIDFDEEE